MSSYSIPTFPNLEHLGSATGFVVEIQEIVKVLPLFENFSTAEYQLLCEYMECFATPRNALILAEGTVGDFMLLILTGKVNVVKSHGSSESQVVAKVGPGSFLGEMSLIDGQRRFASCVATDPTDFAVLTRQALNEILDAHPRLGAKLLLLLLQLTTGRLREATNRMIPVVEGEWL
jgi:CRP-like cAMP-binding protein